MSPWGSAIPDGRSMQRKRRPIVLAIGLAMILASFAMIALGIVRLVDAATIPEDEVVSRGTAGSTMRFGHDAATSAQFTIYIESNSSTSSVVDLQVSRISCLVELSDGTTRTVRGANQSTSTQINETASIGTFTAIPGQVSVSCEASDNAPYSLMIATGGPRLPLSAFGLVFGGVGVLLVGIVLTIIGAIRRTVRVPAPT